MLIASGCSTTSDFHNIDGVRMFQQGNYSVALQRFQQAVAANPQNPDAYYNLASAMHRIGAQTNNRELLNQAETVYNQCLDLNENHVECHRGLSVLLVETDRQDKAFKLLTNWVAQQPNSADARIELARLYEEFGDSETAKIQLNQAVMADQRNYRAWAALGQLRDKAGDTEQALANYQRSLSLNPQQPAIGARVASLTRSVTPNVAVTMPPATGFPVTPTVPGATVPGATVPGATVPGTRTVTAPTPPGQVRY